MLMLYLLAPGPAGLALTAGVLEFLDSQARKKPPRRRLEPEPTSFFRR